MSYATKLKWFIAAVVLLAVGSRYGCYYLDQQLDAKRRPWAYSSDQPLLVGRWVGECRDPDGIVHRVDMTIDEPLTDEERWKRANRKKRKRDRGSRTFFDGLALVETQGRLDTFELWGGLDAPDGHQIHFQWRPLEGKTHPPGFNLNAMKGDWQGDAIDLEVGFSWFRQDGSSFSDSADPRYSQKGQLLLKRAPL